MQKYRTGTENCSAGGGKSEHRWLPIFRAVRIFKRQKRRRNRFEQLFLSLCAKCIESWLTVFEHAKDIVENPGRICILIS